MVKQMQELDESAMAEFKSRFEGLVEYVEKRINNILEGVLAVGKSGEYDLVVVGKGRFPSTTTMAGELAEREGQHAELGPIGDILASSEEGIVSSVLVIRQHDIAHEDEVPVSKVLNNDHDKVGDGPSGSGPREAIDDLV